MQLLREFGALSCCSVRFFQTGCQLIHMIMCSTALLIGSVNIAKVVAHNLRNQWSGQRTKVQRATSTHCRTTRHDRNNCSHQLLAQTKHVGPVAHRMQGHPVRASPRPTRSCAHSETVHLQRLRHPVIVRKRSIFHRLLGEERLEVFRRELAWQALQRNFCCFQQLLLAGPVLNNLACGCSKHLGELRSTWRKWVQRREQPCEIQGSLLHLRLPC
mmetsp:Transcript_55163/g.131455  ORF Transcript_55163/g.131455 Transcript_55163/m.131455 type:complete len:215 (+) Transcript_55163:511-1155(+)